MSNAATLSDLGITRDQASKWMRLAQIPEHEFEAALSQPGPKPTTEGLLRKFGLSRPVCRPTLNQRLDAFRLLNGFSTRVDAVRWLLEAALDKKLAPKAAGKKGE
jgi:hypothetical protein